MFTVSIEERMREIGLESVTMVADDKPGFDVEKIVSCPDGYALRVNHKWGRHVAENASNLLGKEIVTRKLSDPDGEITEVFYSNARLSFPERHTLTKFSEYFEDNRPGLNTTGDEVILPDDLKSFAAPLELVREDDAFEIAAALTTAFGLKVDVAESDNGYVVIISDPLGDLFSFNAEQLAGACQILKFFRVFPKFRESHNGHGCESLIPWQQRVGSHSVQQRRVEDILMRLENLLSGDGGFAVKPTPKPSPKPQHDTKRKGKRTVEAVDVFEDSTTGDAHRLPAKPARKTAKKS